MAKNKSRQEWLQAQNADQFVKQARDSQYRSRAVYKLQEIDKKDKLFQQGQTVVDLGAAPGSWSQYAVEKTGSKGHVVALDLLPLDPIPNVSFIQGDFTENEVEQSLLKLLNDQPVDLVISDMAPNLSGIKVTDQARSMALAELVLHFCHQVLKPGGNLLIKLFEGAGTNEYRQQLREHFAQVLTRKPQASRDKSREFYVLARAYRL